MAIWSQLIGPGSGGDVTSSSNITDNAVVRGDGGAKGIQDSGVLIDDSDNVTGVTQLTADSLVLTTDLAVDHGGSGRSASTEYAVICGGTTTTGAHQSIASVGTSGQILTSNGPAALPTFQNASSGISSAFNAFIGTTNLNKTGDTTNFYLGNTAVGTTLTERLDTGGDFTPGASGGAIYTSPANGSLQFNLFVLLQEIKSTHTAELKIITSNQNYTYGNYAAGLPPGNFPMSFSLLTDMDLADTAQFVVAASGSTKTVDIFGDNLTHRTVVSGFLI